MAKENIMNVNEEVITLGAGYIISAPLSSTKYVAVREEEEKEEDEDIYADEEVIGNDELAEEFGDDED